MTGLYDTAQEVAESIALDRLVHFMAGLYIWDFILTLGHEYSIVMGKRKFIRTYPLYMGCRWSTLFAVILQFVYIDRSDTIDCQVWISMTFIFTSVSVSLACALVTLRVCALWERNKIVIAIASAAWLVNVASMTYVAVTARGHQDDSRCIFDHVLHTRISIFTTFITDLVLLVLMLSGVLRWKGAHGKSSLWGLMYMQGLTWIVVFALAEVPPVVFIGLNLGYHLDLMCLIPGVIAMTVGASRMHLGLVNSTAFHSCQVGGRVQENDRPRSESDSPAP